MERLVKAGNPEEALKKMQALAMEMDDFLAKPFVPERLTALLERWLSPARPAA